MLFCNCNLKKWFRNDREGHRSQAILLQGIGIVMNYRIQSIKLVFLNN